jgi:1-acyl-sn-glycerol-3-phosphate acyltransferase
MDRWNLKPATDFGLPPRARLMSLRRESGLVAFLVQRAWRLLVRAYLSAYHRLTVAGIEHLPAEPPYVLVANHTSHLDALILAASAPAHHGTRTFPIAAGDTFFERLDTSIFAAFALNALPLWRRRPSPTDLAALRSRLIDQRSIYILFPEGTRARDGMLQPFKAGIGRLVAGTGVPVVPCHISGAFAALPPHRTFPRPRRLGLTIGAPLHFAEASDDKAGWQQVAAVAEAAVRSLERAAGSPRV